MFRIRLSQLITTAVLAIFVIGLYWLNPFYKSTTNLTLGLVLIVIAIRPLVQWLRNPRSDPVPVLAMTGMFYALCFGMAAFVTPEGGGQTPLSEPEYTYGLIAAIASWLLLQLGYAVAKRASNGAAPRVLQELGPNLDPLVLWILYPASALADYVATMLDLAGLVQITFSLHQFFTIWVLHAAWKGRFTATAHRIVLLGLLPVDLFLFSGIAEGKLAELLVVGQLLGITYAVTKGRLPYVPLLLAVVVFFLLQPVKNEYRLETWGSGYANQTDRLEGLERFFRLGVAYYRDGAGPAFVDSLNVAYTRINHLQVTSAIIADTPNISDFRYGETYIPLLTKWIPRFLWQDKPREDLGNRWAQEYGYLTRDDDVTSFNLPWLPEMYMNFGWGGVLGISAIVGALMGWLWRRLARPVPSAQFAFGLVMLSRFFFPESNLSLHMGGLVIGGISILAVCWLLRSVRFQPSISSPKGPASDLS
jgi:hypothetical protein